MTLPRLLLRWEATEDEYDTYVACWRGWHLQAWLDGYWSWGLNRDSKQLDAWGDADSLVEAMAAAETEFLSRLSGHERAELALAREASRQSRNIAASSSDADDQAFIDSISILDDDAP